MKLGTSRRFAAMALIVGVAHGCHTDSGADDPESLTKVTPAAVSTPAAWSLFDRSVQSSFIPGGDPVRVALDHVAQISAIKVYGAAPYRLRATGADGGSIGFAPVDLSNLGPGWHVLPSSALVSTNIIQLQFEAVSKATAPVPELELWAVDDESASTTQVDLAAKELPASYVTIAAKTENAALAPSDCGTFDLEIARTPSAFARAYLVYATTGAFRPFVLRRSINGLAEVGGSWMVGDASARTNVEEIDPAVLHLGSNDVSLCVPGNATQGVAISNLHVVAELDTGINLGVDATVGSENRDARAAIDRDPATTVDVAAGERLVVDFARLIAPDALEVAGPGKIDPRAISSAECIDRAGKPSALSSQAQTGAPATWIRLDGAARSCSAVALTFAVATTIGSIDIVGSGAAEPVDWAHLVVSSPPEHFGATAWVAGFLQRPSEMTGAVRVDVAGNRAEAMTGDFGSIVRRAESGAAWPLAVVATLPDGSKHTKQIVLDKDVRAQLNAGAVQSAGTGPKSLAPDAMFGRVGATTLVRANKLSSVQIRLGTHVGVDVPAGAVGAPTDITVRHLDDDAVPPLDPGMINVTAPKGHGFEFLPHGQHFARQVEVIVPYDPSLIPDGMTPEDVHTFFFDPTVARWKKLDRHTIDVGDKLVRSGTDHFTIMVDAVLAVPKNTSPLSLDPTSLSSIGAASPAANIDMIEPPQANSQGDARLSLPIRVPQGRGAYTPNLGIAYSSATGDGWLGVGWDLAVSRVEIDSRWGVPTYGENAPRYQLDGAELVPTLDQDGPRCQDGKPGRRYHTRIEGAFAHILRCDHNEGGLNAAAHYGFEVYDRTGTLYVYGPADERADPANAELADPEAPNGIFRWFLRQVVDVHGNTSSFEYAQYDVASAQPGRDVYLKSITYTSHPSLPAAYRIDFTLDDGQRPDAIISARGGFKTVTQHLLRSIEVRFHDQIIRQYVLTYRNGEFDKSLLAGVRVYGLGGCSSPTAGTSAFSAPACGGSNFFFEHTFDYFDEPQGFHDAVPLHIGGTPDGHRPLAAGASSTTSNGLFVSAQITKDLSFKLGTDLTVGSRDELVGMYDMNGDGLPDDVFATTDGVAARYNELGPDLPAAGDDAFGFSPVGFLVGLPAMGHESHTTWNADLTAAAGASLSAGFSTTATASGRFITDLNGDGYPDYLSGHTLFGEPCPQGTCFSESPFDALSSVDPRQDPLLTSFSAALAQQLILAAPVVQWTAPYAGHIRVSGTARKPNPGGTDGVTVELYQGDTLVRGFSIGAQDTSEFSLAAGDEFDVQQGDAFYVRARGGTDDGMSPQNSVLDAVMADLHVDYVTTCETFPCEAPNTAAHDPTGEPLYSFDSSYDFRVAGTPTFVVAPVAGTFELHGVLDKAVSVADVRACVQRFPRVSLGFTANLEAACDASGSGATNVSGTFTFSADSAQSTPIDVSIPVQQGDIVLLRVESDFSYDPRNIGFRASAADRPIIAYSSVCLPNGSGEDCASDTSALAQVKLPVTYTTGFGPYVVLVDSSVSGARLPLVVSQSGTMSIEPFDPGTDYILAVRSDRQGLLQELDCRQASCGTLHIQPFAVDLGESVTVEMVSASSGVLLSSLSGDIDGHSLTIPLYVDAPTASTRAPTPFAGGYHGWRVSLWNDHEAFKPIELLNDYQVLSTLDPARLGGVVRTAIMPVASFGTDPFAGNVPAWIEPSSAIFVTSSQMAPGFIGVVFEGGAPEEGAQFGLFVAGNAHVSGTSSKYAGLSTSLVNVGSFFGVSFDVNASESDTVSTTDLTDLTGDGVADILWGRNLTVGKLTTDPASRVTYPDVGPSDGLRRRHGFDYSVGLGANAGVPLTNARGRTLLEEPAQTVDGGLGWGTSVGVTIGRSETTTDLMDVNGDGLPDLVRRRGADILVRLNLGKRFGAEEVFGSVDPTLMPGRFEIDGFQRAENDVALFPLVGAAGLNTTEDALEHTTTITQTSADTTNLILYSSSKTTRQTASRVTRQLEDLNGDGLPDLVVKRSGDTIRVQYNLGTHFGPPVEWTTPDWSIAGDLSPVFDSRVAALSITGPDVLAGTGSQISTSSDQSIGIPIPFTPILVGGHIGGSTDVDTYELSLMDINGDGAADHVLRRSTTNEPTTVYVKFNEVTGQANLLREVHRPLGGSFTLTYKRVGNTVSMPHSRQVLQSVDIDDGVDLGAGFESPNLHTAYSYVGGFYSRNEKEFFGFSQVTTTRNDQVQIVDQYENATYPLHGRVLDEKRLDQNGNLFHEHTTTYDTRAVIGPDDNPLALDPFCIERLHPLLGPDACTPLLVLAVQEDDVRAEGGSATKTHRMRDTSFDRFGNVLTSVDEGDDAIASDDLDIRAEYANAEGAWILGRPTSLVVRAGTSSGTILRSRSGTYDDLGELTTVSVDTGSGLATSHLGYDVFGNLTHIETPPNESGQTQTYNSTFDPDVASYDVATVDGFGYRSTATYDLRFGVATTEIDVNGASLQRTLDAFGRLSAVAGPYDVSAPALSITYSTSGPHASATTVMRTSAPASYTGTLPAPVTSVVYADGIGRTIETLRTAVVDGQIGMTVSGQVARDAVGHVVSTYNPKFLASADGSFVFGQATEVTRTAYDAMDRPVTVTYPDQATETTAFDIAAAPTGATLFRTRHVDPNDHARETYVDLLARPRAFVEHPSNTSASTTTYDYLATGELAQITDAENHVTTLGYDLRGLRTRLDNPDDGLVEDHFDLMGNRVALVEPNHRASGTQVHYLFDRDRLSGIDFPSKPDVAFAYGPAGAGDFSADRIVEVSDESGTQQHSYGAMGEITRTVRTVLPDQQGSQSQVFDTRFVVDSLGRQLQISYPDGETVTNSFDAAGNLQAVIGRGTGWTQTYASDLRYDRFGNRTRLVFGNGTVTASTFDPNRIRLTSLTTTLPSQTKIQDLHYHYDVASNPTQIENTLPTLSGGSGNQPGYSNLTLEYDGVDRLTRSIGSAALDAQKQTTYDQQLVYSPSHNILHKQRVHQISSGGTNPQTPSATNFSSDYTYGARPHMAAQIGDLAITYDPSGNPITRVRVDTGSQQNMVWDDDNRLVDYTGGGVHQHNTFDASGLRVRRKSTQSETIFANAYFDLENGTGGVKHVFVGGMRVASKLNKFASGANPSAPTKQGVTYYFHGDQLQSTHVLTNDSASVQESLEFFTDGEQWINRGPQKPVTGYLFSGKPYDPDTGFYDYGQRFYEPRTGLWLGVDSAFVGGPEKSVGRPMMLAPFAFCGLSPVGIVDPDGRDVPSTHAGQQLYRATFMAHPTSFVDPDNFNWDTYARTGATPTQAFATTTMATAGDRGRAFSYAASTTLGVAVAGLALGAVLPADVALSLGIAGSAAQTAQGVQDRDGWQIVGGVSGLVASGGSLLGQPSVEPTPSPAEPPPSSGAGWQVGEDVYALTSRGKAPSWSTVRSRFWQNEAASEGGAAKYGAENLPRMKLGRAPQRYNPRKGGMERMELSHEPIPAREGGKAFVPRWPEDHARVDPYRRPGY